ncbi:MAG TPA: hypothetical protein PLT92_11895 [Ignavibacteriaceae bacterium]|nr:hypothetical protein [Ignavibacteriaceae bacterium]
MSIFNFISENYFLPLGDMITGNSVRKCLDFLLASQWWSKDKLSDYQNYQLRVLVNHCCETVPYYYRLFKYLKLTPSDIKTKDDLYKLPILRKDDIKREGLKNFTSTKYHNKELIFCSSSGSTGEPLFYNITKYAYSLNIAAEIRGWYWMNYRLGDRYIKLSQNPRSGLVKIIQDRISRNRYLSTNQLNTENFRRIIDKIVSYKPKVIRSYPDPLHLLSKYVKENNYKLSVENIVTTGNTLHDYVRKDIEEAFNSKIFDTYNCEGNPNFFECPTHNCYHATSEYGILEVVNEDDENIPSNGIGRLISTDIANFSHPFIRYDTQDLVEVSSNKCSCNRNLFEIKKILGRDNDIIESSSGARFIVHHFTAFFSQDNEKINRSIEQFQIIKKKNNEIDMLLKVNNNYSTLIEKYVKEYWKIKLESAVNIVIVDSIPITKAGKRKFIINE